MYYTIAEAQRIAGILSEGETDGWAYTVINVTDTHARIEVTDEDGELVTDNFRLM